MQLTKNILNETRQLGMPQKGQKQITNIQRNVFTIL